MIYYTSPYNINKDLGVAYNKSMQPLAIDDWMCFKDGDVMFLTSDYGHQIQEIINKFPETGIFTCLTNRIKNPAQLYNNQISNDSDILNHKNIAFRLQQDKRLEVKEHTKTISGMLFIIKKSTWNHINGAPEGRGLLTVDNTIANRVLRIGKKILIMQGLYVFHSYRLGKDIRDTSHLK